MLVELSNEDIQVILHMLHLGRLEISRQMKRLSKSDFDLKEYYWFYRCRSNELSRCFEKLKKDNL